MRYPDITKNTSTPTNPPGNHRWFRWKMKTERTAIALSPSMAGRYRMACSRATDTLLGFWSRTALSFIGVRSCTEDAITVTSFRALVDSQHTTRCLVRHLMDWVDYVSKSCGLCLMFDSNTINRIRATPTGRSKLRSKAKRAFLPVSLRTCRFTQSW